MPEEAQIELSQTRIDGFSISAFDESEEDFRKRVADREAQIKAAPDRLGGNRNLESARDVKTESGLVGKIFMHSRTVVEGTQGNGLGVERDRHEGISVEALVHSQGISIDLAFENRGLEWIEDLPRLVNCLVSCDHLPRRSWPLFRAKAMLGDLIAGFSSPGIQSHQEQLAA